jgi:hypothetical protein
MSGPVPNLTQFYGVGPQMPLDGQGADPALDFSIPSAWENPDLWDSVVFTDPNDSSVTFTLPPIGYGRVKITTPVKAKLDDKGGAGKKAPRTTKTGGEATKDVIDVECVEEGWPYILAAARVLIPGSGPWNVVHPKFDLANIAQVMIEEWEDAPSFGEHALIEWKLKYSSVSAAAQTGTGGGSAVDTPWTAKDGSNPKTTDPNKTFHLEQGQAADP